MATVSHADVENKFRAKVSAKLYGFDQFPRKDFDGDTFCIHNFLIICFDLFNPSASNVRLRL
jgi:hypothetical protein